MLVEKIDKLIMNQFLKNRTPRVLKWLRIFLFCLAKPFIQYYYLIFYHKNIRSLAPETQLFFVGRNDYGTQLYLLNYVKLWQETRGPTGIAIFTDDYSRIKKLAAFITPHTRLIFPFHWPTSFPMMLFGSSLIHHYIFPKIYPYLEHDYPNAICLFYPFGTGITEYNKFLDHDLLTDSHSTSFKESYIRVRNQFDYRWDFFKDYFSLYASHNHRALNLPLKLPISKRYVVLNVNCKTYYSALSDRRRIHFPERYNALIDMLISLDYEVVLQGRSEQPAFVPRQGFIDYARSTMISIENDLALFSNCEFAITSKSGIEILASICNKPVLGLNYTEILGMQPAKKMRFYPKYIRHRSTGRILSWKEHLSSSNFFEIGENNYSHHEYDYIDISEYDMVEALKEFLNIQNNWNYSCLQQEFKSSLTPLHLELYQSSAVPCDHYLKKIKESSLFEVL